jgi:hypothetical protein
MRTSHKPSARKSGDVEEFDAQEAFNSRLVRKAAVVNRAIETGLRRCRQATPPRTGAVTECW